MSEAGLAVSVESEEEADAATENLESVTTGTSDMAKANSSSTCRDDLETSVEAVSDYMPQKLRNVIGVLPGK